MQSQGSANNSFNRARLTNFYSLEELLKIAKSMNQVYAKKFLKVYTKLNLGIIQDSIKYGVNNIKRVIYRYQKYSIKKTYKL